LGVDAALRYDPKGYAFFDKGEELRRSSLYVFADDDEEDEQDDLMGKDDGAVSVRYMGATGAKGRQSEGSFMSPRLGQWDRALFFSAFSNPPL
jgi:hypothetical protein